MHDEQVVKRLQNAVLYEAKQTPSDVGQAYGLAIVGYSLHFSMAAQVLAISFSVIQGVRALEPYQDPLLPPDIRADDLLKRMTLEEKISQTWSPNGGNCEERIHPGGVGQMSSNCYSGSVALRNKLQRAVIKSSRFGIPASFHVEALHSGAPGGTVFPESVTLGATWDPQLVKEIGAAIAEEARAFGADVAFSPVLNMWTDP